VKYRSRSLAIYNNEFILDNPCIGSEMINWIATERIGNYCILKSHTCHITSSSLQHVIKMCSSSTNASGKRWHHSPTAGSIICISQGSVATVLKLGGQNYSHLGRVSSWCCTLKIIKISQCFAELFKKYNWHVFMDHSVYYYSAIPKLQQNYHQNENYSCKLGITAFDICHAPWQKVLPSLNCAADTVNWKTVQSFSVDRLSYFPCL